MLPVTIFVIILSIYKKKPYVTCKFKESVNVLSLILFFMSLGSMSHVWFKKSLCRPVEFRGQGPLSRKVLIDRKSCMYMAHIVRQSLVKQPHAS